MGAEYPFRRTADWLRGAALLLSLVLLAWFLHANGLGELLHRQWIDNRVLGHGLKGYALLLAITAAATALGFPRQVPSLLAGYAYGVAVGLVVALAGTVAGASFAYGFARVLGRGAIPRRLRARMGGLERVLARRPFATTLMVRLFPVGSNLITNLIAGLTRVPLAPFLGGSALGFVPQTLVFALIGKGLRVDPVWRIGLALVLFVLSALLSRYLSDPSTRPAPRADVLTCGRLGPEPDRSADGKPEL
jgi:uncharacterized membrane protein YdjX (TVP38/TMEM64 family)